MGPKTLRSFALAFAGFVLSLHCSAEEAKAVTFPHQRALIIHSNLAALGDPNLRWLYQFLESAGIVMALSLAPQYHIIRARAGSNATLQNFALDLKWAASSHAVVDAMAHLHGTRNTICFAPKCTSSQYASLYIADVVGPILRSRLRMMYTTACYGTDFARDSIQYAGFDVASGALGVNSDSAVQYPQFLWEWFWGLTYRSAVELTPAQTVLSRLSDLLLCSPRFPDCNSTKEVRGNGSIRIYF